MAKLNTPKVFNYVEFKAKSLESKVGFTYTTGAELSKLIPNSDFFYKNIVLDDEAIFIYQARGLMMIARPKFSEVQDTFILSRGKARVSIVNMADQKVVYVSKMFYKRSFRFWSDLGNYAYISKLKIDRRPICLCLLDMDIVFKFTNQVYWVCRNKNMHPDGRYVSMWWDLGLYDEPDKVDKSSSNVFKDFLETARRRNRKYLKNLSKQYKKTGKKVKRRSRL